MSVQRRIYDSTVDPTNYAAWRSWLYSLNLQLDDFARAIGTLPTLPVYADNTTATAHGLAAGQLYKTSTGQVMQVY